MAKACGVCIEKRDRRETLAQHTQHTLDLESTAVVRRGGDIKGRWTFRIQVAYMYRLRGFESDPGRGDHGVFTGFQGTTFKTRMGQPGNQPVVEGRSRHTKPRIVRVLAWATFTRSLAHGFLSSGYERRSVARVIVVLGKIPCCTLADR